MTYGFYRVGQCHLRVSLQKSYSRCGTPAIRSQPGLRPARGGERGFEHTLCSRLKDKLTGAIVLIMHRFARGRPDRPCLGAGGMGDRAPAGGYRGRGEPAGARSPLSDLMVRFSMHRPHRFVKKDRARVGVRVALPRAAHAGRRDRQTSMKHRLKPLEAKAAQVPLPFVAQLNGCWCHRSQR